MESDWHSSPPLMVNRAARGPWSFGRTSWWKARSCCSPWLRAGPCKGTWGNRSRCGTGTHAAASLVHWLKRFVRRPTSVALLWSWAVARLRYTRWPRYRCRRNNSYLTTSARELCKIVKPPLVIRPDLIRLWRRVPFLDPITESWTSQSHRTWCWVSCLWEHWPVWCLCGWST